ncbi:hypothetical protein MJT46_009407 [Ovis ammon polii x Ovis aries]|nr:hypothetical protein MJT46_009407 [Ovis ammon polii x Ovis aries]
MRDPFPVSEGKNSRRSRRISRGGALHRKGERNSRVVPPFQESPRCVSPFQRNLFSLHCLDVQAEDRLPPPVHVGQPCGKASWESLVGKTRGKSLDPLIHAVDCVTLLLPLWRKGERNSRVVPPFQESPRCVSPFQRNLFSLHCLDVQAEDRLPPPVHVGQPCGKASWESLVGKTRGKSLDPLIHAADCVTLLLPLWRERIAGVPVASQEEALSTGKARGTPGSCHHSKRPPDMSVHSRGTCFPCTALTFKPRIDSHHVCTWDSPVGKPRGKASSERLKGKA